MYYTDIEVDFDKILIDELEQELAIIKDVIPKSFQSLSEEDKSERYYLAECKCGWWGSSKLLLGGHAIADTGDYADPICPLCGSREIGDQKDPYMKTWNDACKKQKEICSNIITYEIYSDGWRTVQAEIIDTPTPKFNNILIG